MKRTIERGRPGQGRRVLDEEGVPAVHPMGNPDGRLSLYPEDAANLAHGGQMETLIRAMIAHADLSLNLRVQAETVLAQMEATRTGLGGPAVPEGMDEVAEQSLSFRR